ncbi:MAG: SHOCT domain-containing protein [Nitrospinae bacterium]|nr:SHOCT domain-containing protein [Nitrospinota bacterium]
MSRSLPLFLALLILAVSGCAALDKEKKLQKDGLTLMFRPRTALGADGGKIRLQHPVKISQDMTRNHLLSLRYEEMTLMGKEKPVFSVEEADKISHLIAKALNHASPNNIVYFEVDTARGTTAGEAFADQQRLHWRFSTISGVSFSMNPLPGWGITWRMVPRAGQFYFQSEQLFGKKTWENWIVADMDLPAPERAAVKKQRAAPPPEASREEPSQEESPGKETPGKASKKNPDLEEKLRFLKQLHDKGLIDEEEYKRKRRDLVDEYL